MRDIWASKSLVPNVYVYVNCSGGGGGGCKLWMCKCSLGTVLNVHYSP
jgi:hypothetical protein